MKNIIKKLNIAVCLLLLSFGGFGEESSTPATNSPGVKITIPKAKPATRLNLTQRILTSAVSATQEYTGNSWTYWAENNKMILYTGVWYTSGGWNFLYNGTTATTSFRENYAVWFDNQIHYGEWGEYGEHEVIKLFGSNKNDPDNSCIIRIANKIDLERKIQISPGDGTYFKISYKLTNITDLPIEDVRMFELVDFDIPWTGDHGNDIGWYDPLTDFVWVKDESWFQNGFTGNRPSDRHSVNYYNYVIADDANDGELDNNNESAYNDPGIGLQWNAGTLQPGQSWSIDITFWFGQPTGLFAVAGDDRTVHEGQQILFDASDSRATETTIVSYEWDMDGDGEFDDATGINPVWTYNATGIYNVVLCVTDSNGEKAYDECTITVLPAMFKDVTVRSFLSIDGLLIDPASITAPFTFSQEDGESKILWNVGSMNIGDKKTLSFEVEVLEPKLGERRQIERENITNYLDNLENARNTDGTFHEPRPIELMLGPSYVDVISGFGITITADKDEYRPPETATFTTAVSMPEYAVERIVTTQEEFNLCGLSNVDTATQPGSVMLIKNTEGQYDTEGRVSFIVEAPSSAKWGKAYFDATKYSSNDISIKTRSAVSRAALANAAFSEEIFTSGSEVTSPQSLFLEVLVTMKAVDPARSPILNDIRVTFLTEDYRVKLSLLDNDGKLVSNLNTYPITVADYGKVLSFEEQWATNAVPTGSYSVKADIVNFRTDEIVQTSRDSFKILEQSAAAILRNTISTDKLEYSSGENVSILSRIFNDSTNDSAKNLTVDITVKAADGETTIATYSYAIQEILKGANHSQSQTLPVISEMAIGNYTVEQSVKMNGSEVLTGNTTFRVVDSVAQGKGITGTLTADPVTVKRRIGNLSVLAVATNTGNVDLSDVTFRVRIYDTTGQTVIKEFSEIVPLPKAGPAYSKIHPYGSKVELMPGTYPAVLTAEFTYNGESVVMPLDTAGFIVTNTAPVANAGADQSLEGTALPMSVALNGSGSTDENSTDEAARNDIASYKWTLGEQVLSTEMNPTVSLGLGEHTITLTVTDTCGVTGTDTVKISIADTTAPVIADIVPVNDSQHKAVGSITAKVTDSCSGVDYSTLAVKLGETSLTVTYAEDTGAINATVPAGIADGWHNALIAVSDKAGNAASAAWRFLTDATAPVISDMLPGNGSESEEHSPVISAKIADATSGIDPATVVLKVNGTAVTHTWDEGTGKISFNTTDLTEAVHHISLTVSDKVGNESSAAWSFTVLPVAVPGITGTLTADPITVKRRIGDLSVLATATNSGNVDLSDVTFRVKIYSTDGQTVLKEFSEAVHLPKSGTGYSKTHPYGAKVELMPGTYPMDFVAEFTFRGNNIVIPLSTGNVIVTNTPPVANAGSDITVTTTAPAGAAVSLNGSGSTDENSTDEAKKNDIVKYEWKKGETLLGSTETLSVNLAPGAHDLTLTVTDICGATHSDTVKATVSLVVLPPTISDLAPPHETITRELGLSAKATDAIWGIEWTSLVFKAGETILATTHDGTTGVITSALPESSPDGWYNLNIFIKNQGGADATTPAWRVGLDRTPPTITELAPAADVYSGNAQPTITAKLADAFSGVKADTIKVAVGETELEYTFNAETGVVTASVPEALESGWHNAKIEVADNVGNAASATWRIGVDKTAPVITGMTPASNAEIDTADQEISAVVSDEHSGIKADCIVLKLNNTTVSHTYNSETGKVSFSAAGLANGEQTVYITVSDNVGNVSDMTWTFNVQVSTGSDFLIFSNSKTQGIQFSGTYITVNGRVHTNSSFASWSNTTKIETVTAVGQITGSGNVQIENQQAGAPVEAIPVYDFDYYVTNANHVHPNGWQIAWNETVPAGIHYVNGNVMIPRDLNADVTIVATGDIQFSATSLAVRSPDTQNRMALFSKNGSVRIYGNQCNVYGIVYAPKGSIHMGSTTKNIYGGLIGNTVENYSGTFTVSPYRQP